MSSGVCAVAAGDGEFFHSVGSTKRNRPMPSSRADLAWSWDTGEVLLACLSLFSECLKQLPAS